ncbi:ABC transporter ATP-binding protein [Corynebacterium caspium]|uniref:ABC transporter ATP-binding protein n=1 Tax=Corynebacterium caspium TaxID=234828 RepID=UPI00037D995A|nr:ATP-binding cassette domain-containing protein [Corynebacterium caspium]WKD58609.1 SkfA peptide export ATP-binding protein SkfE [Corynebacterium caspium DSM 44850]
MAEAAIEFRGFSKSFGSVTAVEDVSFSVEPGRVVGLLGENGAGKTTCIRGLLGLLESDAGDALIFGKPFSTRRERVDTVLEQVSLTDAENRSVQKLSQGMKQRLALATALLPDPDILLLDEPTNGLDPTGIRWLRTLLRNFVAAGKTVLLSSHLLNEVEQTVDDVVILKRTVKFTGSLSNFTENGHFRLEDKFFELMGTEGLNDVR